MGSRTVQSGSISRGKNDPSQSIQMIERALMTTDELKSMPKGHFIVMKTGIGKAVQNPRICTFSECSKEEPLLTREQSDLVVIRGTSHHEPTRLTAHFKRNLTTENNKDITV